MLALTAVVGCGALLSAHRTDEYLQAARIAIEPGRAQVELDLTPGMGLADAVLGEIDVNRDGVLSAGEQRTYAAAVLSALALGADGTAVALTLDAADFPGMESIRGGEGTIRLRASATLPRLSAGPHQLVFRNTYHQERSAYLANALVPESERIEIMTQRRDTEQRELRIGFVVHESAATSRAALLFGGGIAAATVLLELRRRASRAV